MLVVGQRGQNTVRRHLEHGPIADTDTAEICNRLAAITGRPIQIATRAQDQAVGNRPVRAVGKRIETRNIRARGRGWENEADLVRRRGSPGRCGRQCLVSHDNPVPGVPIHPRAYQRVPQTRDRQRRAGQNVSHLRRRETRVV